MCSKASSIDSKCRIVLIDNSADELSFFPCALKMPKYFASLIALLGVGFLSLRFDIHYNSDYFCNEFELITLQHMHSHRFKNSKFVVALEYRFWSNMKNCKHCK